jgi:hypothetical protein
MVLMKIEPSLAMVQSLPHKPVYNVSEFTEAAGSRATAYRSIHRLEELGIVKTQKRGLFTVRSSAFQPYQILVQLIPSLQAIKKARYFGRSYDESDVNRARGLLNGIVTLDYRAYELTHFQSPQAFAIYVENQEAAANKLKSEGFSEGRKGRVAILPMEGPGFENETQRVYLDCLANGGRSTLDAIAIELLHGHQFSVKGEFPAELVVKVREDLPREH